MPMGSMDEKAFAEEVVDLFDEESWAVVNYTRLVDLVHQRIATHPLHQQRCENYVQLAALVSSTNVSEGRRSDRSNALSCLMRPFNQESALRATQLRGKKVAHIEGRQRTHWFANKLDSFNKNVEKSKVTIGDDRCKKVLDHIDGDTNKASRKDLEDRKDKYAIGVRKKRKTNKSEVCPAAPDCSAEMGGGIKIKELTASRDNEIKAEIIFVGYNMHSTAI